MDEYQFDCAVENAFAIGFKTCAMRAQSDKTIIRISPQST